MPPHTHSAVFSAGLELLVNLLHVIEVVASSELQAALSAAELRKAERVVVITRDRAAQGYARLGTVESLNAVPTRELRVVARLATYASQQVLYCYRVGPVMLWHPAQALCTVPNHCAGHGWYSYRCRWCCRHLSSASRTRRLPRLSVAWSWRKETC